MSDPDLGSASESEDDALLAELRSAMETVDPAPPEIRAKAARALEWDLGAAELMDAVFDSLSADSAMRSDSALARDLVFEGGGFTVELTITDEDTNGLHRCVVQGVVEGPEVASLWAYAPAGDPVQIELLQAGRFRFDAPASLVSIEIRGADGESVRTNLISTQS